MIKIRQTQIRKGRIEDHDETEKEDIFTISVPAASEATAKQKARLITKSETFLRVSRVTIMSAEVEEVGNIFNQYEVVTSVRKRQVQKEKSTT